MSLAVTLEGSTGTGYQVISRGLAPIWMKASINDRDLLKRRRQGVKGAAYHKLMKESPSEYAHDIYEKCKKMSLPISAVISALQELQAREEEGV